MAIFWAYRSPKLRDVPSAVIQVLGNLPDTYHVFIEFLIGSEADIDFAVLQEKAICVVEVKNKHGAIRGGPNDDVWTAEDDIKVHEFPNPFRQVRRYEKALRTFITEKRKSIFRRSTSSVFEWSKLRVFPQALFVRWDKRSSVAPDSFVLLTQGLQNLIADLGQRSWDDLPATRGLYLAEDEIERVAGLLGLHKVHIGDLLVGKPTWRPRLDRRVREDLRTAELNDLERRLGSERVIAIVGEPFAGKSSVAQLCARRYAEQGVTIFDHDFRMGPFSIMSERMYEALEVYPVQAEVQDRVAGILDILLSRPLLVILDNVEVAMEEDEIEDPALSALVDQSLRYKDELKSAILMTSRRRVFTRGRNEVPKFDVGPLSEETALPFLVDEYGLSEEEAREVLEAAAGNAHALHVGALKLKDYGRSKLMDRGELIRGGLREIGARLYREYTELTKEDRDLVDIISLSPAGESVSMIGSTVQRLGMPLASTLEEAVLRLHRLGLVSLDVEGRARLLPLLREHVYDRAPARAAKHNAAYECHRREFQNAGELAKLEEGLCVLYHAVKAGLRGPAVSLLLGERLWDLLEEKGQYETLLDMCRELRLSNETTTLAKKDVAAWCLAEGRVLLRVGRVADAQVRLEDAEKVFVESGDQLGWATCLVEKGFAVRKAGGFGKSEQQYYNDALALVEGSEDLEAKRVRSRALGRLARAKELAEEETTEIIKLRKEALTVAQSIADLPLATSHVTAIGGSYLGARRFDIAQKYYTKGLGMARFIGDRYRTGAALAGLGKVHERRQQPHEAKKLFLESLELTYDVFDRIDRLGSLGNVSARLNQPNIARRYYEDALKLAEQVGGKKTIAEILDSMGSLCRANEDLDGALNHHRRALEIQETVEGDSAGRANRHGELARTLAKRKQYEEAEKHFKAALRLARVVKRRQLEGWLLGRLGEVLEEHGRYEDAVLCYQKCMHILEEEIIPKQFAERKQGILQKLDKSTRFSLGSRLNRLDAEINRILES